MKEFLHESGVPFTVANVAADADALAAFRRTGYLTPPVTVVDGVAVWGYDPARLEALLADEPY
ncbi:MAG: glutaredoxin family protein [Dehalococcoidia bacterium]